MVTSQVRWAHRVLKSPARANAGCGLESPASSLAGTYGILLPCASSQHCPDAWRHALPHSPEPRSFCPFTVHPASTTPSASPPPAFSDHEPGLNCVLSPVGASESPDVLVPIWDVFPIPRIYLPGVDLLSSPSTSALNSQPQPQPVIECWGCHF